jgi:integrase
MRERSHRADGKPAFDFEKSWKSACKAAGIPKAGYHDLRRTALRNMIEAGFSEKGAIEISGHNTRAVFEGYQSFRRCGCDGLAKGWKRT